MLMPLCMCMCERIFRAIFSFSGNYFLREQYHIDTVQGYKQKIFKYHSMNNY